MRIISGRFRGHSLRSLKGAELRPTSDQMRQTLFDVLGPAVAGRRFMDAYAGSGAVGLEALSRGAGDVVLVESGRPALNLIARNLESLDADGEVRVLACRVEVAIDRLSAEGARFDYLFLDPPYSDIAEYHRALRQIGRSRVIEPTSTVIAEHSRHLTLEDRYARLGRVRLLRHGDSQFSFYRLSAAE